MQIYVLRCEFGTEGGSAIQYHHYLWCFELEKQRPMARRQGAFTDLLDSSSRLIGAIGSALGRSRSKSLLKGGRTNSRFAVASMSWREFERLVSEAFQAQGFTVTGFGGNRPEGGVDLGISKNGERYLVQCKHWRKHQVGITVVRELNGAVAAMDADGGYVVTGGAFTREAQEFADSFGILLVDGAALEELIGSVRSGTPASVSNVKVAGESAPMCPRCGAGMVRRKAIRGEFIGQSFWGCQQYPMCTAILRISC
jgi:restriction system protein